MGITRRLLSSFLIWLLSLSFTCQCWCFANTHRLADTSLIAHDSVRYTSLAQVKSHPFFKRITWDTLRSTQPPFVPTLDNDEDTGYYDDFTSPEDMAKYAEVLEKQKNVDAVREKDDEGFDRGVWVGFTFGKNGPGVNGFAAMAGAGKMGGGPAKKKSEGDMATIF